MVGRKPKPTDLHVIAGTLDMSRHANRENEPRPAGKPEKPKWLRGKGSRIWDELIGIGSWLTAAESLKLAAFCQMSVEVAGGIEDMTAARIAQWRALGSELGFDPSARARLGVKSTATKTADPAEKFFKPKNVAI